MANAYPERQPTANRQEQVLACVEFRFDSDQAFSHSREIVAIAEWYFKDRSKANLKITYIFVGLLAGLTLGVFVLAIWKIVSGDTVIFLIGSLFGYVFAFLQRYLGPSS